MSICRLYLCDQVGGLTYDGGKGTLRLTDQTVLWLLGPWGPSEKAMSSTHWRDFHSYWTGHNIWDAFGTNSLIKRTVWERNSDGKKRTKVASRLWSLREQEKETEILRKKPKLIWPFPVNSNFQSDSLRLLHHIHDNIPPLSWSFSFCSVAESFRLHGTLHL